MQYGKSETNNNCRGSEGGMPRYVKCQSGVTDAFSGYSDHPIKDELSRIDPLLLQYKLVLCSDLETGIL